MDCPVYRHGKTKQGTSTVTLERDEITLVVRGVPAQAAKTAAKNTSLNRKRAACWHCWMRPNVAVFASTSATISRPSQPSAANP